MPDWVNSDGLRVRFDKNIGTRKNRAGVTQGAGKERELVLELNLVGAARTLFSNDSNDFDNLDTALPAGAKILRADVINIVTPAGGTSFTVGTFLENGTADDDDGLITSAGAPGAQVGTQLTAQRFVTGKTTGTYTAGRVKVVVSYLVR